MPPAARQPPPEPGPRAAHRPIVKGTRLAYLFGALIGVVNNGAAHPGGGRTLAASARARASGETELFFKRWLNRPKGMGSVVPSSRMLARAIASAAACREGEVGVELGAGTGAITRGLMERLPPDSLVMVELDPSLVSFLRQRFPEARVLQGDASQLASLLAAEGIERVRTVVSGLPMVNMPLEFQRAVLDQSFAVLPEDGFVLQYSYSPIAPIPVARLGLEAELVRYVLRNIPPATVWRFTRPTQR
jgi:phosphatidylethanolamine/phosphatidyl-N-methylethanolamine N-methyltransferase